MNRVNGTIIVFFALVVGCRLFRSSPEPEQPSLEIKPGLGLKGKVEIGMKLAEIYDAKMRGHDSETGEKYLCIPEEGIYFTVGSDNTVDSISFCCAPNRPDAGYAMNANTLIHAPFRGGIADFTNRIDNLRVNDVISVFGVPPKVDRWYSRWCLFFLWNGVPSMTYLSNNGDLYFLHYPEVGITFHSDLNCSGYINSITVRKASSMADCVVWHGVVRLGSNFQQSPVIDFGTVRGGGGKLHLFTLLNDTNNRICFKQPQPFSPRMLYGYGFSYLDSGESTYLWLMVLDKKPEWVEIPVVVLFADQQERTITLKMRKVECGWDAATIGKETVRGH